MAPARLVIVHGIGGSADSCFYQSLRSALIERFSALTVEVPDMPDPDAAKESVWIPYLREVLKVGPKDVLCGHSSGASAAQRYAERYPVAGLVLISAALTDMGVESERLSEYFNRPWQYDQCWKNAKHILQICGVDDPFVPCEEQRANALGLKSEYVEFESGGHFVEESQPEMTASILTWVAKLMQREEAV